MNFRPISFGGSSRRFIRIAHLLALAVLPFIILLLVRANITALATVLVILAKWRAVAVRPRFWLANIRANAIDIIVGLSAVGFIVYAPSLAWQLVWAVLYAVWLVVVKPSSSTWVIGLQSAIGEVCGLIALYVVWGSAPLFVTAGISGIICFLAARHFFDAFEEAYAKLLAYLWAVFAAATTWLMGHLLFFYGPISQPTVLLTAISVGVGTLYYLDHFDKSSKLARRQIIAMILIVMAIIFIKLVPLMFYVWSDSVL